MRKLAVIISSLIILACDSDNAPDCLKSAGTNVTKVVDLGEFNQLIINDEFNVIITEGSDQMVSLTTGENLIDEVEFSLNGNVLEIKNTIRCKWVRDYDFPILKITHPNLEFIEIVGGSTITSNGILNYSSLSLKSKDSNGIIRLSLNCENLTIDNNEITNYFMEGSVINLRILFSSGDSRFEGANLSAINADVSHKSSNDIVVNVSNRLGGSIGSTGDLIYVGEPPTEINVTTDNRGRLIDGTN